MLILLLRFDRWQNRYLKNQCLSVCLYWSSKVYNSDFTSIWTLLWIPKSLLNCSEEVNEEEVNDECFTSKSH